MSIQVGSTQRRIDVDDPTDHFPLANVWRQWQNDTVLVISMPDSTDKAVCNQ